MTIMNPNLKSKDNIVIALGDPAGIGIEVTLKALGSNKLPAGINPLLVGCKENINFTYSNLSSKGITHLAHPKDLNIINMPINSLVNAGEPNEISGDASFRWLTSATDLVMRGDVRAIVTAPISKYFWHQAGHIYPGQTERLAEIAGTNNPSMLFTAISPMNGWRFNTLLATTHIPLSEIPKKLTPSLIEEKLDALLKFCKIFKDRPRLVVAGLNPHAGEEGKLGTEEIEWLIPLINRWKANNTEIQLDGPIAPDTCWLSASRAWQENPNDKSPDGILALYHDQGLIPMKLIAFDQAVNTTLGLPFIRTSPDHGTAFDIAGKGLANSTSMLAALTTAWELSNQN